MATTAGVHTATEEPPSTHPQPPSPPTSPTVHPFGQTASTKRPAQAVDGKTYYGYLFNKDKTPTALLVALLRSMGDYIANEIGDKNNHILDKVKLAAFYRAVGGDYDSLFVNAPDKSISYIWQALGVQHTLQPTDNDFLEPSIPALTLKGFVRWQSLQILLGPEEHVPFMQFAVRNWALKHPETGEPFPTDLPSQAFPAVCDSQIDQWHRDCAKRLRHDATPAATEQPPQAFAHDPKAHVHFTHVRPGGPTRQGPEMDYFERLRPNIPFIHVPGRHTVPSGNHSQSPHKRPVDSSSSSSPDERGRRRRSVSDIASPARDNARIPTHIDPRPPPARRHSQPKYAPPQVSDTDSDSPPSPRSRSHRPVQRPTASVRVFPPDVPTGASTGPAPSRPSHRADMREDDPRRRSLPSGHGHFGIRQKLTSLLPGSSDRTRSASHSDRDTDSRPGSGRHRGEHPSSRLGRRWSDEPYTSGSDSDVSPKQRSRNDREREYEKGRERHQRAREREIEDERDRHSRKDRAYLRPNVYRRTSSATEIDRRPKEWDAREKFRDRERERERERERDSREFRRDPAGDDRERRSWRDRESGRERDKDGSPVVVGVGGRRYPAESMKAPWA